MFNMSPNVSSFCATISAFFKTGSVSPVKLDSSIFKLWLSNNLQSAGTYVPASNSTISPGTKSSAWISCILPSLTTFAIGGVICFKASIDFSAFASWMTPISALNTTIAIIIIEST